MMKLYGKLCCMLDYLRSPLLLVMRLYWGYGFFIAGKGKLMNLERTAGFFMDLGIPFAKANAILAGSTECFGGLLLLIGLFSRLVSIPLAFTMCIAFATAHNDSVVALFANPDAALKEDPFLFLLTAVIVMAFGAGRFSVDAIMKKNCCKEDPCHG
ncbi:MAG: DoxX family protein [Deltaproteobacteria bacterium CG11_big_fil_rev_8_21_14_0_20_47_16]|nr:MAG: DoxX family protein [Deltaproteobacteria bacterium CG11_big_fil_rev_8_21_14_0_20_47_16]